MDNNMSSVLDLVYTGVRGGEFPSTLADMYFMHHDKPSPEESVHRPLAQFFLPPQQSRTIVPIEKMKELNRIRGELFKAETIKVLNQRFLHWLIDILKIKNWPALAMEHDGYMVPRLERWVADIKRGVILEEDQMMKQREFMAYFPRDHPVLQIRRIQDREKVLANPKKKDRDNDDSEDRRFPRRHQQHHDNQASQASQANHVNHASQANHANHANQVSQANHANQANNNDNQVAGPSTTPPRGPRHQRPQRRPREPAAMTSNGNYHHN